MKTLKVKYFSDQTVPQITEVLKMVSKPVKKVLKTQTVDDNDIDFIQDFNDWNLNNKVRTMLLEIREIF